MQAAGPGATLRHPTPICRCARDPRRREVSAGFACSAARLLGLAFSEPSCVLLCSRRNFSVVVVAVVPLQVDRWVLPRLRVPEPAHQLPALRERVSY